MRKLYRTADGSVGHADGRLIFLSCDRFVRDIVRGGHCFVCGAKPGSAKFNDEHVIPKWVLKRFGLFDKSVVLPNKAETRYRSYKIPCCVPCNDLLSKEVEVPVSALMAEGWSSYRKQRGDTTADLLVTHWLLLKWMSLIFVKTHLRDLSLRFFLDERKGAGKIGESYEWEELHHIHCIARSPYTQSDLDAGAFSSLWVLPVKKEEWAEPFDYRDMYLAKTALIQLGDVAILAVLNDSCAALSLLQETLIGRISGPLGRLQVRELLARVALANLRLEPRPKFHSEFTTDGRHVIGGEHPSSVNLADVEDTFCGEVMHWCVADVLASFPDEERSHLEPHIKNGDITFLFDENGEFIR